jgi:chromate reductase
MKIVGISGSLRVDSKNTSLLKAIAKQLEKFENVDFEIVSIDLPLFDGNHSKENIPESVSKIREQVKNADGLVITCPEYNWNITTALKNAIDWLSLGGINSPLRRHVVAIAGVGGGRLGSVRSQMTVRQTLLHDQVWVIPGPEVLIAPTDDLFDKNGDLTDPVATSLLDELLSQLVKAAPLLRESK